jgi:hypothetical protein
VYGTPAAPPAGMLLRDYPPAIRQGCFDLVLMLTERHTQRLLQHVACQHDTRARLGKAARDHGAAFPGGGVAAAPVEIAELLEFCGPGPGKIAEQCSTKTSESR